MVKKLWSSSLDREACPAAEYREGIKLNFFKGFQKNLQKLNKKLDGKRVVV